MNGRNFFAELKRRNVYRVAVAYLIVGWLLIQIATSTFPVLEIPNWAIKLVIALVLLGFPIALLLAWAFEITPEGIKREHDLAPGEAIPLRRGRKLIAFTAVAAVIAAGLFAFQWLKSRSIVGERPREVATGASIASAPIPEKSIAVLPFENLSSDKENAYFVAGIQDEILTRLAKIGALKVISRSSTLQFQSKPRNLREIARELPGGYLHWLWQPHDYSRKARQHPAFQGFAKRIGLVDYWKQNRWPDLCQPAPERGPDAFTCQ